MGISNFYTWLKDEYSKSIVSSSSKSKYNYIYIDLNHVLHNSMSGAHTELDFFFKLDKTLELLFCNYIATKQIIIAIDGTSPYSKIMLQRKRRMQSSVNSLTNLNNLNSLSLTPGTDFMKKVDEHVKEFLIDFEEKYKFIKTKIIFIPSSEPNEGEIKVFKKLVDNNKKDPFSTHLVIGNDADLVILAMSLQTITNVDILIKHNKSTDLLKMDHLINEFYKKFKKYNEHNDKNKNISNLAKNISNWRLDFCLISIMLGNDYFPKLRYVKYETIWNAYFKTIEDKKSYLFSNHNFNYDILKKFMQNVILNIPIQFKKFNPKLYNEKKVVNYLEGLLWCLNMYNTGECSKYDYIYEYKNSPTPADILHYLQRNKLLITLPISKTKPINANIYTLFVMPYRAKKLIPKKYHNLVDNELNYLYDIEKCEKCLKFKSTIKKYENKFERYENKKLDTLNIKLLIEKNKKSYTKHKKTHKFNFGIDDINKIIELTGKI